MEAFNLAVSSINDDFVNYPEMKLRPLTVCADPSDDFDNIVKGGNDSTGNVYCVDRDQCYAVLFLFQQLVSLFY